MNKIYIFLRSDLPSFGKGALIAQACHSTSLLIGKYYETMEVQEYLKQGYSMTKVVLKARDSDIEVIKQKLEEFGIKYVEWVEEPEHIVTSICTFPCDITVDDRITEFFHQYKLF